MNYLQYQQVGGIIKAIPKLGKAKLLKLNPESIFENPKLIFAKNETPVKLIEKRYKFPHMKVFTVHTPYDEVGYVKVMLPKQNESLDMQIADIALQKGYGYGQKTYKAIQEMFPRFNLRSSKEILSKDAENMWDRLVEQGKAIKLGDKDYLYKQKLSELERLGIPKADRKSLEKSGYEIIYKGIPYGNPKTRFNREYVKKYLNGIMTGTSPGYGADFFFPEEFKHLAKNYGFPRRFVIPKTQKSLVVESPKEVSFNKVSIPINGEIYKTVDDIADDMGNKIITQPIIKVNNILDAGGLQSQILLNKNYPRIFINKYGGTLKAPKLQLGGLVKLAKFPFTSRKLFINSPFIKYMPSKEPIYQEWVNFLQNGISRYQSKKLGLPIFKGMGPSYMYTQAQKEVLIPHNTDLFWKYFQARRSADPNYLKTMPVIKYPKRVRALSDEKVIEKKLGNLNYYDEELVDSLKQESLLTYRNKDLPKEINQRVASIERIENKSLYPLSEQIKAQLKVYKNLLKEAQLKKQEKLLEATQLKLFKVGGKSPIHIKKANRGKFTQYCGGKVTSECIAKGMRSPNPKIRKQAVFANNARKWKR